MTYEEINLGWWVFVGTLRRFMTSVDFEVIRSRWQWHRVENPSLINYWRSNKPLFVKLVRTAPMAWWWHLLDLRSLGYSDSYQNGLKFLYMINSNSRGETHQLPIISIMFLLSCSKTMQRSNEKVSFCPYVLWLLYWTYLTIFYISLFRLGSTFGPKTQPSETDMRDFYTVIRYKEGNVVMSR
jgi:hypothetical protein